MRAPPVGDFGIQLIEEFLSLCHLLINAASLVPVDGIEQLGWRLIKIDLFGVLHSCGKCGSDLRREDAGITELPSLCFVNCKELIETGTANPGFYLSFRLIVTLAGTPFFVGINRGSIKIQKGDYSNDILLLDVRRPA